MLLLDWQIQRTWPGFANPGRAETCEEIAVTKHNWYQKQVTEVFELLDTSQDGLSSAEAQKRLERDGKNELITGRKTPAVVKFLLQFKDVFMVVLLVAAGVSFLIRSYRDGIIMLIIVVINAIIGFFQ